MAFEYLLTTTRVKAANAVLSFDVATGIARFNVDIKGLDWDPDDANYPEAKIYYDIGSGYVLAKTIEFSPINVRWRRTCFSWTVEDTISPLVLYSDAKIKLVIYDEDAGVAALTQEWTLDIDLSQMDKVTILHPHEFGDTATPVITFAVNELPVVQVLKPGVTVGVTSEDGLTVELANGDVVNVGASGVVFHNNKPISEWGGLVQCDDSDAARCYCSEIVEFRVTSPSLAATTSFNLDLRCENV